MERTGAFVPPRTTRSAVRRSFATPAFSNSLPASAVVTTENASHTGAWHIPGNDLDGFNLTNSIQADPMFVDPHHGDFHLLAERMNGTVVASPRDRRLCHGTRRPDFPIDLEWGFRYEPPPGRAGHQWRGWFHRFQLCGPRLRRLRNAAFCRSRLLPTVWAVR